jgi:nucleoside-diphosphate-sugar epimerase
MKLLLTGANGFIGSYFRSHYGNKYSIEKFSFLNDDIDSLHTSNFDVVIHLSALVHQMGGASASEYEKVNVIQTLQLARKAKEQGVKHFIFMSTVKVYGEESNETYSETSRCKPQDEYGKSKLRAENELKKLEDERFIVSIVRTPIVYGYGVKANIKNLISIVRKIAILPFGSIDNQRSMVYVGNLTHLLDKIIETSMNGIFLASDDRALSTTDLIELIVTNVNKKRFLVKIPFFESLLKLLKPSFHKRLFKSLQVNNESTKQKLDLKNPYTVEDGIKFMIHGENI